MRESDKIRSAKNQAQTARFRSARPVTLRDQKGGADTPADGVTRSPKLCEIRRQESCEAIGLVAAIGKPGTGNPGQYTQYTYIPRFALEDENVTGFPSRPSVAHLTSAPPPPLSGSLSPSAPRSRWLSARPPAPCRCPAAAPLRRRSLRRLIGRARRCRRLPSLAPPRA